MMLAGLLFASCAQAAPTGYPVFDRAITNEYPKYGKSDELKGYVAFPTESIGGDPFPGIMVVADRTDNSSHLMADRLAADGFYVLVMDWLAEEELEDSVASTEDPNSNITIPGTDNSMNNRIQLAEVFLEDIEAVNKMHAAVGIGFGADALFAYLRTSGHELDAAVLVNPHFEDLAISMNQVLGISVLVQASMDMDMGLNVWEKMIKDLKIDNIEAEMKQPFVISKYGLSHDNFAEYLGENRNLAYPQMQLFLANALEQGELAPIEPTELALMAKDGSYADLPVVGIAVVGAILGVVVILGTCYTMARSPSKVQAAV